MAAAAEQAGGRPPVHRMPSVPLALRLRTSPSARRLVPRRAALSRARRKGERRWRTAQDRERVLAATELIVARTARAGEVEELARLRLIEEEASRTLFWAPWRHAPASPESARTAREALASGRPLLFSGCHLGPYFQQLSALPRLGIEVVSVAGAWLFEKPPADLWGRRVARWAQGLARAGVRPIPAAGSFELVRALLERGEPVGTYFDVPGSVRTQFLGKAVDLASGSSRLAHQTGALIVPLRTWRDGTRVRVELLEPLDPHAFTGALELHNALAAAHERSILQTPYALEDPSRPGSWEAGASATAWIRPDAA